MDFKNLNLVPEILRAVEEAGYTRPTPIQQKAIPAALEGRDILGCAQTGTGKTAAFALPILQRLAASPAPRQGGRRIRALILTPTRELALQIDESFRTYGKYLKFRYCVVIGGVSQVHQIESLKRGCDVLVATPGRLIDLHNQWLVDISEIEIFVLDEADRMLDMGFIHDVRKVMEIIPRRRQTLFFTATLPGEIVKLSKDLLERPVEISVTPVSSTVDATEQKVYLTDKSAKTDLLIWLLTEGGMTGSVLVFTRTKHGADRLSKKLQKSGIEALAIHGDKSQGARQNALDRFKSGRIGVLVATDIAARGIDIEDLANVVNFELPNVPETYVHRIGRTGRAGKTGCAVSLCDFDEKDYLRDIEKLIRKQVHVAEKNPYPMTVFVKSPPRQQNRPGRKTKG